MAEQENERKVVSFVEGLMWLQCLFKNVLLPKSRILLKREAISNTKKEKKKEMLGGVEIKEYRIISEQSGRKQS